MDADPSLERFVAIVQELSLSRSLADVMRIVRHAARELTGADGATFVLRDGEQCHYADEDAIAPLWKGRRFPLHTCISGWTMLNRQQAVIEDVYADPRIPADAYRPTFVKSLVMVPIRTQAPLGAIGTYWATRRRAVPGEVHLLQALADTTAVALENVAIYEELEHRIALRTAELAAMNQALQREVVAHRQAEEEIRLLSLTDELTGLRNRRGFFLLAAQEMKLAQRAGLGCSLIFADLDGFKQINDRHGHLAGDAMLTHAAAVLKASFRDADVVARLGGDEFVVLAINRGEDIAQIEARIQAHVKRFNDSAQSPEPLSLSIGAVCCTPSELREVKLSVLLADADASMYRRKQQRRQMTA